MAEVFGLKQLLEVSGSPASSAPLSVAHSAVSPPRPHPNIPIQDKDADIAGLTQRAEALEAELQDISCQESKDEASLAKVKKQLRDLEAKAKDQEEELDEQAGTIQMLEQVGWAGRVSGRGGFAGLSLLGMGPRRRPPSPRRQAWFPEPLVPWHGTLRQGGWHGQTRSRGFSG